jgi:hypothetical protein
MIKELTYDFLSKGIYEVYTKINKGETPYDIEYILMYELNMYWWNDNDPLQETLHRMNYILNYDCFLKIFVVESKTDIFIDDIYELSLQHNSIIIDSKYITRYFKLKELNLE